MFLNFSHQDVQKAMASLGIQVCGLHVLMILQFNGVKRFQYSLLFKALDLNVIDRHNIGI